MKLLEKKLPPLVVLFIFGCIVWLISKIAPAIHVDKNWHVFIILFLILGATLFCTLGVMSFKKAETTVNPLNPENASTLVISGIYKISRNPMYVGFALFLLAWASYLTAPFSLIGVLGFIFYMNRFQIVPEERALLELFGKDFEEYKAKVRRWL